MRAPVIPMYLILYYYICYSHRPGTDERVRRRVRRAAPTGLPVGNRIRRRGEREWYRRNETAAIYAITAAASDGRRRHERRHICRFGKGSNEGIDKRAFGLLDGRRRPNGRVAPSPRVDGRLKSSGAPHQLATDRARPPPPHTPDDKILYKNGDIVRGI